MTPTPTHREMAAMSRKLASEEARVLLALIDLAVACGVFERPSDLVHGYDNHEIAALALSASDAVSQLNNDMALALASSLRGTARVVLRYLDSADRHDDAALAAKGAA